MHMLATSSGILTGFVPSLEVMAFIGLSRQEEAWRMRPFPGYGRMVRYLLTGQLHAGLLPWEICLSDLVSKPGQKGLWCVPLVVQACPTELVLSSRAMGTLYPGKGRKPPLKLKKLVIGVEGRHSFTRFQVLAWQAKIADRNLEPPSFKVLPMELMEKGIEAETLDGFVAPTPWGMQAAAHRNLSLAPNFEPGRYAQHFVLACSREVAHRHAPHILRAAADLHTLHRLLGEPAYFQEVADTMQNLGHPHCETSHLQRAFALHLSKASPKDFSPDRVWIEKELQRLSEYTPLQDLAPLPELATQLALSS